MDTKYNSLGNLSNTDRWQMFPSARLDLSGKSALYDYNFTSTTTQPLRQKSGLYTELSSQQRNSYMSDSTSPSSNSSIPHNTDAYGQGELTLYTNSDMNDKLELHSLLAELDASRELNKTLSLQLAKAERDYQSLKIQQELQHDQTEAAISARITEIIGKQYAERKAKLEQNHSQSNGLKRSLSQSKADRYTSDNSIDASSIKNKEMQQIFQTLNQPHLSPMEISTSCQAMLQYIKRHGCTVGVKNGANAGDITLLRKENDKLTTKVASLTENLKAMEEVGEKLRHQLVVINGEKSDLESERDTMESKVVQLQQQLAELKYTTNTQSDRLLEENRKYVVELTRLKAMMQSTSDAHVLAELEGQKRELSIQLEKLQQEKEELVLQKNTLESRLGDYESQDGTLGRRRSLTAMSGASSPPPVSAPSQIIKELEQLRREKSSLTAELSAAYSSLQDIQDGTHQLTEDLKDKLNSELGESSKLRQKLESVTEQCKFLSEENQHLTASLEQHKNGTELNLEELKRKNTELIEQLSSVQLKLSQANSEESEKIQKFSTTNLKLADQMSALQVQLNQTEKELEQIKLAESEKITENQRLTDELSTLKKKLSQLESQIGEMQKEKESLKDTLANQSEALLAAKEAVSQSTAQLDHFKADRSEKELEKLRGKFEQQEAKWQFDLYELRQKYSESETENFKLSQELMQLKRDSQELKEKFLKLQREDEQLRTEKTKLESNLKALENVPSSSKETASHEDNTDKNDSVKLLRDECKKLSEKNEEQKRLITVLRRKLALVQPPQ